MRPYDFANAKRPTAGGNDRANGTHPDTLCVADAEIKGVRRLITSTLPVDPYPFLEPEMAVEVRRGPFQGLRGFLIRKAPGAHLVIAVSLIRQGVSVEIDADMLVMHSP